MDENVGYGKWGKWWLTSFGIHSNHFLNSKEGRALYGSSEEE